MRFPKFNLWLETLIKIIIITVIILIANKIKVPQRYFYLPLLILILSIFFSYIDEEIDPEEKVYLKDSKKISPDEMLRKKRRYYSKSDKIWFYLFHPTKIMLYIYALIIAFFILIIGNRSVLFVNEFVGKLVDFLMFRK